MIMRISEVSTKKLEHPKRLPTVVQGISLKDDRTSTEPSSRLPVDLRI